MTENASPTKSKMPMYLMCAGSIVLLTTFVLALPARFQESSFQSQSEALDADIAELRADLENAALVPEQAEADRIKQEFKDLEKRTKELGANIRGSQRNEGRLLLGMATGCLLISSAVALMVFGKNSSGKAGTGSGSDGPVESNDA